MVLLPATEDYYALLEVEQSATTEQIVKSYRRLALKLHPDRNANRDATANFQLLGRAYETLKDASSRQAYDAIYPSIRGKRAAQAEARSEAEQIAALQKSKQERAARWWTKKTTFESTIFELQRHIRRLEQQIDGLKSIVAAEVAAEAQENSWGTWLLSPFYKRAEESAEEKERKSRERQERRIERDMKERRLAATVASLKNKEASCKKAKDEVDAADGDDDRKIGVIQARINARAARERQEKERVERQKQEAERQRKEQAERERQARFRQQQAEQQRQRNLAAAEAARKLAEARAAQQKRQNDANAEWLKTMNDEARRYHPQSAYSNHTNTTRKQGHTSGCLHEGWWDKVLGRTACPECGDGWKYLLECPTCPKQACPKCQAAIRRSRGQARVNRAKAEYIPGYD